jgi:hypothetical protein
MVAAIKSQQDEVKLPDTELIQCIWQGLMKTVDWSAARADQIEGLALREITVCSPWRCIANLANMMTEFHTYPRTLL